MYGGVHVSPAFGGTGYNDKVRHYPDFASRLYFMEGEVKSRETEVHVCAKMNISINTNRSGYEE